jgi:flagellar M-ring protein FliF
MWQFFTSMSQRSRVIFATCLLLIACVVAGATWWIMHPPYGVLFSSLREADAAEITTTLGQMQVPYRLADEGKTILVPAEQVYDTRMKLVSQGVPKGGSVGFELFKDSDYGVTEFAQKVNFQRALQGELERTIESLDEVASARVHLTIHRTDLFEHDQDASKASVTLSMRPEKHLDARGVVGIQRLVASAVDALAPESVVVLDDKGMVLSGHATDGQGGAPVGDRLDEQAKVEALLRARIGELLQRVLLTNDFTVSVNVRLNYDHVKQVSERLIPQGRDGNGLMVSEKTHVSGRAADESNPDQAKPGPSTNERDIEYAHGREQEEVEQAPGRIERVSVGIVIPSSMPRSEIDKLSEVVSAGLGLDPARGDKVDIAAIAPPELAKASTSPLPLASSEVASASAGTIHDVAVDKPVAAVNPMPTWGYPVITALVLIFLVALVMAGRGHAPRRLSAPEREEALARLRQWIEPAEIER